MPKILGLNLLAVLAASVAFFLVGCLWYGILFADIWMEAAGIPPEAAESENPIWMAGGFLITVLQVIGIGLVLKWKGGASDIGAAAMTACVLWFFFALPFAHYAYLYGPAHSATMLMIDASHFLVGWVVSAVVLTLMK